nr:hypothetical protein Iba_chr15aCG13120 [Ipomoea batatas]
MFNINHSILCRTKSFLTNQPSLKSFFRSQLLKSWHNSPTSGYCNQLQLHTTNPSNSRQISMH